MLVEWQGLKESRESSKIARQIDKLDFINSSVISVARGNDKIKCVLAADYKRTLFSLSSWES